jgi:hypothetical protein
MKSKRTLILVGAAYVVIILVIILIAVLVKKDPTEVALSPDPEGTTQSEEPTQDLTEETLTIPTAQEVTQTPYAAATEASTLAQGTQAAQATPTGTNAVAFVPTATPTSAATLAPTLSPTQTEIFTPVDWTGNWTAFFGDEGGLLFRATITISRSGNTITGVHSTQIFTGTLTEDGLSVVGTWVNQPMTGSFSWTIVSEDQFCGNTEGAFAYCAARNGANRPDPCICFTPDD